MSEVPLKGVVLQRALVNTFGTCPLGWSCGGGEGGGRVLETPLHRGTSLIRNSLPLGPLGFFLLLVSAVPL